MDFQTFDFKKCRDLEIQVSDHSRSSEPSTIEHCHC